MDLPDLRRSQMKLVARQKYDYRDLDRGEAQLIRIGHALWRDRLKLGDTVAEGEGINAALESVWQQRRNIGQNWPGRGLCDSQSTCSTISGLAILPKPLESLRRENIDAEAKDTCGRSIIIGSDGDDRDQEDIENRCSMAGVDLTKVAEKELKDESEDGEIVPQFGTPH
jgi:hypothetical protein